MDEPEKRDASRGVSESTVTVDEHAVDGNPVDSEVSTGKGRVDDMFDEEAGRVEGGDEEACNGDDIMVEVLGSDVYVDGVCTNRTVEDFDEVGLGASTDNDHCLERDGRSSVGDDGVSCEPVIGVPGGETNEGVQSTVEGESGLEESAEKMSEEVVKGSESTIDAMVLDSEARTSDSEAIHVEKDDVATKEDMDVEISRSGSDQGGSFHNSPDDRVLNHEESQNMEIHPEQSKDSATDNGFWDDSQHAGEESQLVGEDGLTTDGAEALGEGQGQESVEECEQFDPPAGQESKQLGISDANVGSRIRTSSSSADGNINLCSRGEDAPELINEKNVNFEDNSHGDASENVVSEFERDESSVVETEHEDTGKNDHVDDQSTVAGKVELASNNLINGQEINGAERLDLSAEPKSVGVPEVAGQALSTQNLDLTTVVSKDVSSTNSISSSQSHHMNAEEDVETANDSTLFTPEIVVCAEHEPNFNVQKECRNMESSSQANGQGDIAMNVEPGEIAVNDSLADSENLEEMEFEQSNNDNQVRLHSEEEMEDMTHIDNGDDQILNCAAPNSESFIKVHRARYLLPSENEGDFSVSDLVWGKVRSHPWWPGQIFDPSDSSEKAMKYYKKDFFLVAYFGDRTFAWNEVSHLKPFRAHFVEEEIQSNSETFQNAVECALEEVSRRSELGLACACTPREAYDMIKCQIVENAGIREESSRRYGVDKSASARSFEPEKLIDFIRDLAKFPADGSDRLDLVIAKAQLTAFYRLKGCSLPQFQFCGLSQFRFCGGLVDNDSDTLDIEFQSSGFVQHAAPSCPDDAEILNCQENLKGQSSSYHKRKHNLKDGLYPKKKERSLLELMGETFDNVDGENWSDGKTTTMLASPSAKKRKTVDDYTDDSSTLDGRKTISSAKVSSTGPLKQSFKIGDCIRRVASQLTGTPPIVKTNNDRFQKPDGTIDGHAGYESDLFHSFDESQRGRVMFPTEYSSLDELLCQLQLLATDPMMEYGFLSVLVSFFTDFRDSRILRQNSGVEDFAIDKVSGKRKTPFTSIVATPETFEFEDMSDTYWTDRVIQNGTEVQPSRKSRKREYQLAVAEPEKSLQGSRRPYKKRHSVGSHTMIPEKFSSSVNEPSPAELVMNFSEVDSVPSEKTLNNMFRRFGPLREYETEVDREGGRARVVFKRSSDAEIALSSAGRFNIFGPRLVNYQLSYNPSTFFKTPPMARIEDQEMHLDLSTTHFHEMQLDLASFHDHEMQLDLSSIHDQEMQLDLSTIEYQEMESVLDPNHDQENKPSYTSTQLGHMQADFSTIQYERQRDLALTHGEELHTVFLPSQETESVPTASQAQELQHNFTSTQFGEMQVGHALTHHHEPPVSASIQEQEMQSVFFTVKEEKPAHASTPQDETQSVLDTIHEQEAQVDLDQLDGMQDDLVSSHHNESQTVPVTPQEQEMHTVVHMSLEETKPVVVPIQEQEKVDVIANPTHHEEEQPIPATTDDMEMQPGLDTIQANDMLPVLGSTDDQERQSLTSSQELVGEPISTIAQHPEAYVGTLEGHETEHVLATTEQATQSFTSMTHEDEDIQQLVLTGEKTEEETHPILAATQDLGILPDLASAQEELEPDRVAIQRHELQPNHVTTQENEAGPDCLTSQVPEVQSDHGAGSEQDVLHDNATNEVPEIQCDNGTIQEQDMQCDISNNQGQDVQCDISNNQGQDMQCDIGTNQGQDMQCDSGTNQEQDMQFDSCTNQEQDVRCDNATNLEQDVPCDKATNQEQDVPYDKATNLEQDMPCDNATNQEQDMPCDNATNQEQDVQCDSATNQEQDLQCDSATNQEQDVQCDRATNQGQDVQCDHVTDQDQDVQCDHVTDQDQDVQCDHVTDQDENVQCDHVTDQDENVQCNSATNEDQDVECDSAMNQDQGVQCDSAMDQDRDVQCDSATNQDQDTQCDSATNEDEDVQCDSATNEGEDVQCDSATNEDGDVQCDSATNEDEDVQCGNAPNEDEDVQCGSATNEDEDVQCGSATNEDEDVQCDNAANKEKGSQSGNSAHCEQDKQSDHDQEMQTDHALNQEQEEQSNFGALHELDAQSDLSEKHTTQDPAMQPDFATFPDAERHPDFVPTKDQEVQLGL